MANKVDIDRVRELITYDQINGRLFWRTTRKGQPPPGSEVGGLNNYGYWRLRIDGVPLLRSRVVWALENEEWPSVQIDHINMNRLDDRISNLRLATNAENHRNRGRQKNNTSGYIGVCYVSRVGMWRAYITVNKKQIALGLHKTPEDAHAAYVEAAKKWHGEFARVA